MKHNYEQYISPAKLFQIHSQLSNLQHKAPCRLNEQYLLGAADNYFLKVAGSSTFLWN